MSTTLKIIGIALFYILTIGSGIVMHKQGRPFKPLVSTLHKLIALAIVIVTIMLVRDAFIATPPTNLTIILFIVALVFIISLFVTGAMLSGEKDMPKFVLILHDIATYLSPVALGFTFFLLFKN